MFYLGAMLNLQIRYSAAQRAELKDITSAAMPTHVPVEAYTENRTRPLNVYCTYHEEFWKEEMDFFTEENGWKLVKKNAKDTHREYEGLIKDPTGNKAPLKVRLVAGQGEFDFLEKMSDPDAHLIIYNGHSFYGSLSVLDDKALYLTYSAVPEPSTYVMVLGALFLPVWSFFRRRRSRRSKEEE